MPNSKILFTGDAVFSSFQPLTRFGDKRLWKKRLDSLGKLVDLEITQIVPGHEKLCDKKEIERNIRHLERLVAEEN